MLVHSTELRPNFSVIKALLTETPHHSFHGSQSPYLFVITYLQFNTVEQQSELVQDFYQAMNDRLSSGALKSFESDQDQETFMDNIEKFIMTRLYRFVFCPDYTDDESQDLKVQVSELNSK